MDSTLVDSDSSKLVWETSQKGGAMTSWPKKTTTLCHNCCHAFDTVPVPLPQAYDHVKRIYYCRGIFCSWNCAKSYNLTNTCVIGRGDRNAYISLLAYRLWVKRKALDQEPAKQLKHLDRYSNYNILPSRPKECLRAFGGDMSIDEYRRDFFGIVPPDSAVAGTPARNVREVIARESSVLPFVNLSALPAATTVPVRPVAPVENTRKNPFLQSRDASRGVALHRNANDFCNRLNRATENHNALLKRKRDSTKKNTLMSSMGIVVQKKMK